MAINAATIGAGASAAQIPVEIWKGYLQDQQAQEQLDYQRQRDGRMLDRQEATDEEERRRYLRQLLEQMKDRAKQEQAYQAGQYMPGM